MRFLQAELRSETHPDLLCDLREISTSQVNFPSRIKDNNSYTVLEM